MTLIISHSIIHQKIGTRNYLYIADYVFGSLGTSPFKGLSFLTQLHLLARAFLLALHWISFDFCSLLILVVLVTKNIDFLCFGLEPYMSRYDIGTE